MSPLAKVFVCFNLVLAVFFTGIVSTLFSARNDYKNEITELTAAHIDVVDAMAERDAAQAGMIADLEETKAAQGATIAKLEEKNLNLSNDNENLKTTLAEREAAITTKEDRIAELEKDRSRLDEDNQNLITLREESLTQKQTAEDQKKHAELVAAKTKLENEETQKELGEAQKLIRALTHDRDNFASLNKRFQDRYPDLYDSVAIEEPAPPVDGTVCGVQDNVVVLTVGEDDNVRPGMEFTVFRRDKLVGKVKVTRVTSDLSGAEIMWLSEGKSIELGDDASTVLN